MADVNSVTFTTAGGSQTVMNSTVTQMTRMADAFYVEDEGSTLLVEGVNIVRNQIQADAWSAVAARTGAIVQISNVTVAENTGLEFGVVSFNSMVTIQDTIIRQNTGSVRGAYLLLLSVDGSHVARRRANTIGTLHFVGIDGYSQCTNLCHNGRASNTKSSSID